MSSIKNKVLVLGSIAFDYIMGFDDNFINATTINHEREEYQTNVTASSRIQYFGGTAGNISYNLGLLGLADFHTIGAVGRDFQSLGYNNHLKRFKKGILGIDVHDDDFTAACYIVNDVKTNQMIIFHGGALDKCKDIKLNEKIKDPENYLYAINSTQSVEAMENFANQLHELKIPQIFDPGQVTPLFPKELLIDIIKKIDILIGNSYEIDQILRKTEMYEDDLIHHVRAIIKTKGGEGSELIYRKDDKEEVFKVEIPICKPDKIVDPTGAGDGYRAGLLTGLTLGMTLIDACRLGSVIGSFVVETQGGQTQSYTIEDVRKRFFNEFEYVPPELEPL